AGEGDDHVRVEREGDQPTGGFGESLQRDDGDVQPGPLRRLLRLPQWLVREELRPVPAGGLQPPLRRDDHPWLRRLQVPTRHEVPGDVLAGRGAQALKGLERRPLDGRALTAWACPASWHAPRPAGSGGPAPSPTRRSASCRRAARRGSPRPRARPASRTRGTPTRRRSPSAGWSPPTAPRAAPRGGGPPSPSAPPRPRWTPAAAAPLEVRHH